jgi:hypothetical protein
VEHLRLTFLVWVADYVTAHSLEVSVG